MDGKSLDIKEEKLRQLKAVFPEVFKENQVDFLQLKALLGEDVIAKEEAYGLSWAGKYEAFKEIQKQTTATLIPDREGSIDFDNGENIFIEGENLEVLRVLQKSYYSRVKMVYIDPPYNTGNDFIYNDKFAENKQEYMQKIGAIDEFGNMVNASLYQQNPRESGRFHSVWLSFMYPRLYLAKNLLREDGVIFISIDDNEVHGLKLLMDEVFGEENFIADVIWHSKYTTSNDAKYASRQHEHILFYAKSLEGFDMGLLGRTEDMDNAYKNPDNDPKGSWKATPLHAKSGRESNNYTIVFPNGVSWTPPKGRYPRYAKERLLQIYKEGGLYFNKNGGVDKKTYISEVKQGKTVGTIWSFNEVGSSHQANEQLAVLFGKGIFDNPKPLQLIKQCCKVANSKEEEAIILDFFAGSGTTAQAVLELNEEDGGNRKFICVQLNERCKETGEAYKAGYETIADIAKARIKKVVQRLQIERNSRMQLATNPQSLAFKSYKLGDSNFKKWSNSISSESDVIAQLAFHINSKKEGSKTENMLHEVILKLGIPLSVKIENINSIFYLVGYEIVICLDTFHREVRDKIIDLKPRQAVVLDCLFERDDFLTNTKLLFKENNIELTVI